MAIRVIINHDGVWAGEGRWTDDCEIVDCPASLGPDEDASDETYEDLSDALSEQPDADWYRPVRVERPDGTFWTQILAGPSDGRKERFHLSSTWMGVRKKDKCMRPLISSELRGSDLAFYHGPRRTSQPR